MSTYTLSPVPGQVFLDNNGLIIPGGLLWTYDTGTVTLAATYTTQDGLAHTNPIVLDAYGRPPAEIYMPPGTTQKWVLETATTPPAHGAIIRSYPTVAGVPGSASNQDVLGVPGEGLNIGEVAYLSDGSGGLVAGTWYRTSASAVYSSILPMVGIVLATTKAGSVGSFRLGGQLTLAGPFVPGANYYVSATSGALTATPPGYARFVGTADGITSLLVQANPPPTFNEDILVTAGEALAAESVAYLSDGSNSKTAGQWYLADSDLLYASVMPTIGMVLATLGAADIGAVRVAGRMTLTGPLTIGANYFVSATAGALTTTAPGNARFVGTADSATTLVITANPPTAANEDVVGTAGEALPAGAAAYLSDGSGALTAGRWYKADADLYYASLSPVIGIVLAALGTSDAGQFRIGGRYFTSGLTAGAIYYVSGTAGALTVTAPVNARFVGMAESTTALVVQANPPPPAQLLSLAAGGRFSLESGVPVSTADQSGATTAYYMPYTSNRIALYDGTRWNVRTFSEISILLAGLAANKGCDVFAYDNAGVVTIEKLIWTSGSARATAVVFADGVLVKSGDQTRRLVASFYVAGGGGSTDDTIAKRYIQNIDNPVSAPLRVQDAADSWTYTTLTWRDANNNASNVVEIFNPVLRFPFRLQVTATSQQSNTSVQRYTAIGQDSDTTPSPVASWGAASTPGASTAVSTFEAIPTLGYHYYAWLENSEATGTTTWIGDNGGTLMRSGMSGTWFH